jgi:NTP pyrophosphatase (non-canonical NTP hydrolase)
MSKDIISQLTEEIRAFADARDWHKYHTPKNLAMALAGEAGELLVEFQWLTPDESTIESLNAEQKKAIEMEIADVQIYLLRLSDVLKVDVASAVREKIQINESRF